jgi:hypothetical protein
MAKAPRSAFPLRAALFILSIGVAVAVLIDGCKEGYHVGGGGFGTIDGHSFHSRCEDHRIWHAIIYDGDLSYDNGFTGSDSFSHRLEGGKSIAMEYLNDQTIKIDENEFDLGKGSVFLVSLKDADTRREQLPMRFDRRIDTRKINAGGYREYVENELHELAKQHPRLKQFLESPPARPWHPPEKR